MNDGDKAIMANIGTRLFTMLKGELVGEDQFGNKYYRTRGGDTHARIAVLGGKQRRWVIFNGRDEASKVPAEWHAWLHHTTDAPLKAERQAWQKDHLPNLTGTRHAYLPLGHDKHGGRREKATGDYEAWSPDA